MENFELYIEFIAYLIEAIGILTMVIAIGMALFRFIFSRQNTESRSYKILRRELGKGILLGLEILVAGDIIGTVVIEPTIDAALTLALIVLIRTFLSLSIEIEIEGKLPWRNNES
ncbi:DUF1622 domain-containing protein [Winogradskyella forsetii]|uniref:DUF1622 domain-containing protein n=1 Tax=Winogradskyella forsetii TaxID=2686077 RepID=UPI0015BC28F0|nr:DUF1622 domain-containing protein [Winogradskyella forsetii]